MTSVQRSFPFFCGTIAPEAAKGLPKKCCRLKTSAAKTNDKETGRKTPGTDTRRRLPLNLPPDRTGLHEQTTAKQGYVRRLPCREMPKRHRRHHAPQQDALHGRTPPPFRPETFSMEHKARIHLVLMLPWADFRPLSYGRPHRGKPIVPGHVAASAKAAPVPFPPGFAPYPLSVSSARRRSCAMVSSDGGTACMAVRPRESVLPVP